LEKKKGTKGSSNWIGNPQFSRLRAEIRHFQRERPRDELEKALRATEEGSKNEKSMGDCEKPRKRKHLHGSEKKKNEKREQIKKREERLKKGWGGEEKRKGTL